MLLVKSAGHPAKSDFTTSDGAADSKGEFGQEMTSHSISTGAMTWAPFLALLGRTNPSAVPDLTFLSEQASLFLTGLLLYNAAQGLRALDCLVPRA